MKYLKPYMLLPLMTVWTFSSCSEENDVINDPDSGTVIDPSEDENKEPDVTEPEILLTPCDAQATENAKKLYTYLKSVYGKKTISSTMANVNWNNVEAENVRKITKKYPAMNCYDFIHIHYSPADWIDYTKIDPVQEWAEEGGLVSLMWHVFVPRFENDTNLDNYTYNPDENTFKGKNILTEGTWENKFFYTQMDKVCESILKLQDAGIPAIWRPYHEAAGNIYNYSDGKAWFWWGADGGDVYVKLWRATYDYFQSKGIHNLIWAWTTEGKDDDYYPGDEYVDIVGRDLYGNNKDQSFDEWQNISDKYSQKMVALSECGNKVNGRKIERTQASMVEQWIKGCRWLYFMPWYDYDYNAGTESVNVMCSDYFWESAASFENILMRDDVKGVISLN